MNAFGITELTGSIEIGNGFSEAHFLVNYSRWVL